MQKYAMKIATNDADNSQHRIIIEVNGHEIDILADDEGLGIDIMRSADNSFLTDCGIDWTEANTNTKG